jgi:hypothetical protein
LGAELAKRRGNTLEKWEVALVKAMLAQRFIPQDIQSYFSRPTRSINNARITEIKSGANHKAVKAASKDELDAFLEAWPNVDPSTGLDLKGDELLLKAREAMIAAVQTFNGAGLNFRAELFIVTSIIAWTYLLHAHYRRVGVDYRYKNKGVVERTPSGAEKYWELGKCIAHGRCPLEKGTVNNLNFLLEIRHEIEHRSIDRIDLALSSKLQACCINFNDAIKSLFGAQYSLERRLPIALQFSGFDGPQRKELIGKDLPGHIQTAMDDFDSRLTNAEKADPRFRYTVAYVPVVTGKASKADVAVIFVEPGSVEAGEVQKVLLKPVDRVRYTPNQVVEKMKAEGFVRFTSHAHTALWKQLKAKDERQGFGKPGLYKGSWEWFENWVDRVRTHCQENAGKYS